MHRINRLLGKIKKLMEKLTCDEAGLMMTKTFKSYIRMRNSDSSQRSIDLEAPRTLDEWAFLFHQIIDHIYDRKKAVKECGRS